MVKYTDTQKREAVDLYTKHGTAEAARRTGITGRSILRWANTAGAVSRDSTKQVLEANEHGAKRNREQRERIRSLILDKAEDILNRMDEPHHDYKAAGKELHRVEWARARSGDVKNYAVAFAVLIDKYRLEMGEHTSKSEVSVSEAESVLDAEIMRLSKEHANRT